MSKPVAGQWYELDGKRVWCIGLKTNGKAYMEHDNGNFEVLDERRQSYLIHLPDCTGWDWEPETFPQYYKGLNGTYIRRDSADKTVSVSRDGTEHPWSTVFYSSAWDRISEAEALALLNKPQQPAEDPEEWVVQDRVTARRIVDEERWLHRDGKVYIDWRKVYIGNTSYNMMHGQFDGKEKLELRCRRKDLPKPKRTVTVPKWLVIYSDGSVEIHDRTKQPQGTEVHRVGETTYEI